MQHCLRTIVARFVPVALAGLLSAQAHAEIIRADFSTQITDIGGSGFGLSIGDTFTGSLTVDTSAFVVDRTDLFPSSTDSFWQSTDTGFVVGDPAPVALADAADYVYIDDDAVSSAGATIDRLRIQDRSQTGQINSGAPYLFSLLDLDLYASSTDIFSGTGLDILSGLGLLGVVFMRRNRPAPFKGYGH